MWKAPGARSTPSWWTTRGLAVGEWVLLHVGFAMSKIDAAEAAETLAFMRDLGSVYDEEIEAFSRGLP